MARLRRRGSASYGVFRSVTRDEYLLFARAALLKMKYMHMRGVGMDVWRATAHAMEVTEPMIGPIHNKGVHSGGRRGPVRYARTTRAPGHDCRSGS